MAEDPLKNFIFDAATHERELLAKILEPYFMGIDQSTGKMYFKPSFNNLSARSKILCFLLATKAANLLTKRPKADVLPSEIEQELKMPGGTVRRTLTELRDERLVDQTHSQSYFIPSISLHLINLVQSPETKSGENGTRKPQEKSRKVKRTPAKAGKSEIQKIQIERQLWEPHFFALTQQGNYLARCLLLIKLARESGTDGVTPSQIAEFFKEEIRSPINVKNISYALGKSPSSYTDRTKLGQGVTYRIMKSGEEFVEKFINSLKNGG